MFSYARILGQEPTVRFGFPISTLAILQITGLVNAQVVA